MIRNFLYQVCHARGTGPWRTIAAPPSPPFGKRWGRQSAAGPLRRGGLLRGCRPFGRSRGQAAHLRLCGPWPHAPSRRGRGGSAFAKWDIRFLRVDAESRFLLKLAGVDEPERKRKIIGEEFIRVFEEESQKIGAVDFLAQGTIYPDVIESGAGEAVIKEPPQCRRPARLCGLSRDHRAAADALQGRSAAAWAGSSACPIAGLAPALPGPGLAIRIIGDITKEKPTPFAWRTHLSGGAGPRRGGPVPDQYFAVLTNTRRWGSWAMAAPTTTPWPCAR